MDGMKRIGGSVYVSDDDEINNNIYNNISNNNNNGKVMTDEQLEVLRRQISVYSTICDQLVHLHRTITDHHHLQQGARLGYCDPMMTSSGQKISARQRWTPTSTQLQILEGIFGKGNGTPGKQKVKELTNELSQHGPISETNVYNWFQNRRARSKRKQSIGVEGEIESPEEKKSKVDHFGSNEKLDKIGENVNVQSPELSDNVYSFDTQLNKEDSMFGVNQELRFSEGFDNAPLFESVPRMDYLLDKMEVPEVYHYQLGEEFDISG